MTAITGNCTVLPRSNLTENRGQPRANRGLAPVGPRTRRGRHEGGPRTNRGSLAGQPRVRPRAALVSTACCPLLLRLTSTYGKIR